MCVRHPGVYGGTQNFPHAAKIPESMVAASWLEQTITPSARKAATTAGPVKCEHEV